jgi:hypothetical protein
VLEFKAHLANRRNEAIERLRKETEAALGEMRKKMREDIDLM